MNIVSHIMYGYHRYAYTEKTRAEFLIPIISDTRSLDDS
jgi:hypothetical protein